ncbi:winged helix DNA-binding domain-containing protein [Nocardiopsis valliformis]|uniref:winged helix DNA-binding domain-containing protein n=1 Tax=Nocardiopsis valliformis TaxID=239974 RepID=UPI00034A60CB|nr:winged helix DNA-binding domain-containing protein [Nocardiopsis valliformis]
MPTKTATVLDDRALNRATLARQALLAPSDLSPLDTVAHLGGVQAQEPQEPFVGLWSRLRSFDPAELSDLLTERRAVRVHLMRRTVHLVAAEDALAWRSRFDAMLRQKVMGVYREDLGDVDLAELAAAGRAVMSDGEPRSMSELVAALAERWPSVGRRPLGEMLVAALLPVAQAPPRGLWRARGGVRNVLLSSWLGREIDPLTPQGPEGVDPVGQALVRRYLAAYGPATSTDLRSWCGLAGLPAAVAAVRPELVSFRDQRGRELLDLPDAPRPTPETEAPVRFLPAFDNALLGYHYRSRIIGDEHRGLSVAGERVVLVDGRVAATWRTGKDGVVAVTPLRPLHRSEQDEVVTQAGRLALFLSGGGSDRARIDEPVG